LKVVEVKEIKESRWSRSPGDFQLKLSELRRINYNSQLKSLPLYNGFKNS